MLSNKYFVKVSVVFVVLAGFVNLAAAANAADQIHFTVINNTAVTFDWIGTANDISYGTDANNLTGSVSAAHPQFLPVVANPWTSNPGPFWEAKLTGLKPDTVYSYKIGPAGKVHKFKTPPQAGKAGFRTCSVSDMHRSSPECEAMFKQIAEFKPAIVITTGDTTGAESEGQESADTRFHTAMVWSQDVPWMPIWGNHDWQDNPKRDDLRNYKGRFDLPNQQTVPSSPADGAGGYERCKDWYWFDYGNTRFIAYPERYDNKTTWTPEWQTAAQPIFAAAQNDPNIKFIVTFGHQSAWTSTERRFPGTSTLQKILGGFHTSYPKYVLDLSGHNHNYERYLVNGMTHIINSTGGAYYRTWDVKAATKPANCAYRAIHYGIVVLDFSDNAIKGQFICSANSTQDDCVKIEEPVCSAPGAVIDTFTIEASSQKAGVPAADPVVSASTSTASTPPSPNQPANANEKRQMTPPGEGAVVIFSDDFEYSSKTDILAKTWKVLPDPRYIYTSNSTTYTGSRCAKFRGDCSMEKVISTAGRNNIHVKYARKVGGNMPYEPNDFLFVEWSANGTTWNLIEKTQDTNWDVKDFTCSSAADNNPNFQIRFRCTAKPREKFAFVDAVQVFAGAPAGK